MLHSISATAQRVARALVPSTAKLSYNRWFRVVGDTVAFGYATLNPITRQLPPNHLLVRMGVGNNLLFSHSHYLVMGFNFWAMLLARGWIDFQSNIVDIGVGCGRYARVLRDFEFYGERYSGTYTGIDIDSELIDWCRANFDPEHFTFVLSGHTSSTYKGVGGTSRGGTEEIASGSQDLVFSSGVYTNLLEEEVTFYTNESARMLRAGGKMLMNYFSLTTPPPTMGGRHTFRHQRGIAHIESEREPNAAVAYHDDDLRKLALDAGFSDVSFTTVPKALQQMMIATK